MEKPCQVEKRRGMKKGNGAGGVVGGCESHEV